MRHIPHHFTTLVTRLRQVGSLLYLLPWFAGLLGLGFFVEQSSFEWIVLFFSLSFLGYWRLVVKADSSQLHLLLATAILARFILIFAFPSLSDDVYRFIWDGRLLVAGYNPFDHLPTWYMTEGAEVVTGIDEALFLHLNSPEYYTIYPPVAQAVNALACLISPNSYFGAAVVMKTCLFAAEVGSILLIIKLLRLWKLPEMNVLWYALNPLIIVEVIGNLHFEGMMIFFLLLGVWLVQQQKWVLSSGAMALAVASKLLPLLFFPFMVKRLKWWRSIGYFCFCFTLLGLLWFPLISPKFVQNFSESVTLYFQRFEFNGSLYYFFRWLGYQTEGHNLIKVIGPNLAKVVLVIIALAALLDKDKNWARFMQRSLFAIMVYLLLATTVHPWYASLPLIFCVFTKWRFPILWTYLITWTYVNYSYPEYFENLWMVLAEYLILLVFLVWEYWLKNMRGRDIGKPRGRDLS